MLQAFIGSIKAYQVLNSGNMALAGTDRDARYKVQSGSILIPDMIVSGL